MRREGTSRKRRAVRKGFQAADHAVHLRSSGRQATVGKTASNIVGLERCDAPDRHHHYTAHLPDRQEADGLGMVIKDETDEHRQNNQSCQDLRYDQPPHHGSHISSDGSPAISRSSDALTAINASYWSPIILLNCLRTPYSCDDPRFSMVSIVFRI